MIKLRPLSKKDGIRFHDWINDSEVIKYSLSLFSKINSKTEIDTWFSSLLNDNKNINLGIAIEATDELIGYTGICNISKLNQSGEYYIFIGNKNYWGKGIGAEITKQVLNPGFERHNFNRLMLTVSEPNIGGVKAYTKAGYKIEGRLRQACFRDNEFHDKLIISVLKSEWLQTYKHHYTTHSRP